MPSHISESASDLLKRILVKDPRKRLTFLQIKQHPWFNLYPLSKFPKGVIPNKDKIETCKLLSITFSCSSCRNGS